MVLAGLLLLKHFLPMVNISPGAIVAGLAADLTACRDLYVVGGAHLLVVLVAPLLPKHLPPTAIVFSVGRVDVCASDMICFLSGT